MRFSLLLAVGLLLAQACAAEITSDSKKGEDAVNKKVEHARSVAHLSAAQSEKEIAKLNSEVFPKDKKPASGHWHQESASQMQAQYQRTVASTMGVDPTASVHFGHPHKKAAAKHVDAAPAKGKAAHGKKNTAHAPHKPTAKEEAAAEEAAHAKIDSEVWPSHKEQKWHQESSDAELSHLASVAVNSMPAEKKVKMHAETAAQMQAEHKKETDATFPKRWIKQEQAAKQAKKAKADKANKAEEKKEEVAGARAFGAHAYRKMNLQNKLEQTEDKTKAERAFADKAANKELSSLNKLNSEVFPTEAAHKPLKSVQKHSLHKAAMHAKKHEGAVSQKMRGFVDPHHPMSTKNQMPPSSDAPVPAAGTDVVYMHAPQGGYAKSSPQVNHKSAKVKRAAKAVAGKK